jgi:hypothetical protein
VMLDYRADVNTEKRRYPAPRGNEGRCGSRGETSSMTWVTWK